MSPDCVTIGDTIALNLQNPLQCSESRAAPNLTSSRVIDIANGNNVFHQVCVISAGSYDYYGSLKTSSNLKQIRDKTSCKFYVWIVPNNNPVAAENVNDIARQNNDEAIEISQPASNGIEPSSYKDLASQIINKLNAEGL